MVVEVKAQTKLTKKGTVTADRAATPIIIVTRIEVVRATIGREATKTISKTSRQILRPSLVA